MTTTGAWAKSLGIASGRDVPAVADFEEPYARAADEIAVRALILHGVVAAAAGAEAGPITKWFKEQGIWSGVTHFEKFFLRNAKPTPAQRNLFAWHKEAEWTLLWTIGKVGSLGLPTRCCNTARLNDEIIPPLGADIDDFVASAELRSPGAVLAEDDRTYNLWCYAQLARRKRKPLPKDLNWSVLYERRYAFEWLDGHQPWDEVTCDA